MIYTLMPKAKHCLMRPKPDVGTVNCFTINLPLAKGSPDLHFGQAELSYPSDLQVLQSLAIGHWL
jgi:hypothetical protein